MKEKIYTYVVVIPEHSHLERFLDMFRYSGDRVVERISDIPISFRMEHVIRYEDLDHLKRCEKFFKGQILGRWGSFGCKILDVKGRDINAN